MNISGHNDFNLQEDAVLLVRHLKLNHDIRNQQWMPCASICRNTLRKQQSKE
uniref:Uncharacterized protein n=1 Tax=Arundo donax TaxID=35708 RepID=A0A0A8Z7Z9_ARUDO